MWLSSMEGRLYFLRAKPTKFNRMQQTPCSWFVEVCPVAHLRLALPEAFKDFSEVLELSLLHEQPVSSIVCLYQRGKFFQLDAAKARCTWVTFPYFLSKNTCAISAKTRLVHR